MNKIRIQLYKTCEGDCPFEKWFLKLSASIQAVIQSRLDRIEKNNFGDVKRVEGARGLSEIRLHIGPGYRVYFTKEKDTVVILLHGGLKKSQQRDVKKAQKFLIDYVKRKKQ